MKRRLIGLSALALGAVSLITTTPSGAQVASYAGASDAQALELTLMGNSLTLGGALTEVSSAPKATANGIGALTPAGAVGETNVLLDADGQTDGSTEPTCSPLSLPEVPVLSLATACSSATATIAEGNPAAASTGSVATVAVNATDVLAETPLPQVVGDAVDQVVGGLAPIFDPIEQNLGIDAGSTIGQLFDAILGESADELVAVALGTATADSGTVDGKLVTTSTAQGSQIDVLGRVEALGPVLRIIVGEATSTATLDKATGKAEGTFDPALVRVIIAPDIFANLPDEAVAALAQLPIVNPEAPNEISIPVGQTVCLLEGTPLESCIVAANGAVTETEEGGVLVETSAVKLDLLRGIEGGVQLALADTAAAAGGQLPEPTTTVPAPISELPRTGGGLPFGTAAPIVLLGTAAVGLAVSRRATLKEA